MANVIAALLRLSGGELRAFSPRLAPAVINRAELKVGELRMEQSAAASLVAAGSKLK